MGGVQSKRKHQKEAIDDITADNKPRHRSVQQPSSPTRQRSASSAPQARPAYGSVSHRAASFDPPRKHLPPTQPNVATSTSVSPAPTNHRRRTLTGPLKRSEDYALHTDSFYLPNDWDSEDRFFAVHLALKRLFGDNVASNVRQKLKPGARVAEIGCGNGPWIMDMAVQYPACSFVGIDTPNELSPLPEATMLKNIRFESVDIHKGLLPYPANSFDVIHGRALSFRFGITAWLELLREMRRVLKPGGVVQLYEGYFIPKGTVMIDSFVETLRNVAEAAGKDYDFTPKIPQILENEDMKILEAKRAHVNLGAKDKLSEEFMAVLLRAFDLVSPYFAPLMGLDQDEYEQRVEMFCAQVVKHDGRFDWYSFVFTPTSLLLSNP
ncbi:S-adenosyl-L-methionine-dependent methyltransferase [Fennellomyces sp. T-0311]|nr:S-adenosyl-L-methionine-dependent methyltransferase [Fennellomyces sp. T-0311]